MSEFVELVRTQLREELRGLPARLRQHALGTARVERAANIAELRTLARRRVPKAVFDFVDGAAADEITCGRNQSDFAALGLMPRVLSDVSEVDVSATVLGQPIALPVLAAPTGLTGLTHTRGEAGIARAAHAAGTVYVLSAMASYSIEEISREAPGPTWFQLYVWRDRGLVRDLIQRAQAAGHRALVVSVDVPLAGARERDVRNGFGIPPRITWRSLAEGLCRPRWSTALIRRPRMSVANAEGYGGGSSDPRSLTEYIAKQFDPSLSWDDLAWIRELWNGPLVIKGILHPDDAARAVSAGAKGIIVSNHGGRQLDHAPSTIAALPAVVDAIGDQAEIYLDGGIRRGSDIVKALALGAKACLVGRPLVYGLGAGGDAGASRAFQLLTEDFRLNLALLGCSSVAALDADHIWRPATVAAHAT